MKLQHHAAASLLFSGILLGFTRSWPLALSALATGILMDLDHFLDYVANYGTRFNLQRFFSGSYERKYVYTYVPLHAWEWLLAWGPMLWWFGGNPWVAGAFLGWFQHLLLDQWRNRPKHMAYFFAGRWRQRFVHEICFPKTDALDPPPPAGSGNPNPRGLAPRANKVRGQRKAASQQSPS